MEFKQLAVLNERGRKLVVQEDPGDTHPVGIVLGEATCWLTPTDAHRLVAAVSGAVSRAESGVGEREKELEAALTGLLTATVGTLGDKVAEAQRVLGRG